VNGDTYSKAAEHRRTTILACVLECRRCSAAFAIQRFFLGSPTGIANVGKYQFAPASRFYPGVVSNQTGQNYNALIFGAVASGFVHRPENDPSEDATE
jgi:hypothetical protein